MVSMLLSGAVAGLVGMPQLLGASYQYSLDFPAGLGFTGIAIALLGRNSPIGIAFGALLFGFLDRSAQILDLEGVPKEIVLIMQGVIVLCVVIAYELVRRYTVRQVARDVGRKLGETGPPAPTGAPPPPPVPRRRCRHEHRQRRSGSRPLRPRPRPSRRRAWPRLLLILSGLLCSSRSCGWSPAPTSSPRPARSAAALGLAVPIGMAGLGGLWSERSGVVNIGLEGMMILGTWGAGFAGWQWGPWAGVAFAVFMGALGGLLHALATVTFGVDQIVSGVAINILALGLTQYLAATAFEGTPGRRPDPVARRSTRSAA